MNDKRSPYDRPSISSGAGYRVSDPYYQAEREISLADLWRILARHKKLLVSIVLLSALIASLSAFMMTPVYRAETLLAPVYKEQRGDINTLITQFGALDELAGISLGAGSNTTLEDVAILKSRALTTAFIKEEGLFPVLFAGAWDTNTKQWKDQSNIPTEWDAFALFDSSIRFVSVNNRSGLITLAIEWQDPALAGKWANRLVQRVNAVRRAEATHEAETSIKYLKDQLAGTSSVEIQQAIFRLIEAQSKTKMVANARSEYTFRVIDPAVTPQQKIRPKPLWIITQGVLLGLIIGVFAVFIRSSLLEKRKI